MIASLVSMMLPVTYAVFLFASLFLPSNMKIMRIVIDMTVCHLSWTILLHDDFYQIKEIQKSIPSRAIIPTFPQPTVFRGSSNRRFKSRCISSTPIFNPAMLGQSFFFAVSPSARTYLLQISKTTRFRVPDWCCSRKDKQSQLTGKRTRKWTTVVLNFGSL